MQVQVLIIVFKSLHKVQQNLKRNLSLEILGKKEMIL